MVTMPPRHGKSFLCSQYFPAWLVGNLKKRVILCSYEAQFAASWGRKARDVLEEWGPTLYNVKVSQASSAADWWELEGSQGAMMTAGVGGPVTGKGADCIVLDDVLKNAEEAASETIRRKQIDWYTSTLYTRREPNAGILLIMTRWHELDLAGWLLAAATQGGDQWEQVNFPAIAEVEESLTLADGSMYTRHVGDALWPARYPVDQLERTRTAVGSRVWSALYQQRPSPDAGLIWKREWFSQRYRETPTHLRIVQAIDTAFKTGVAADYSVIATWGASPADYYLLDLWRARVEFPELKRAVADQAAKWTPSAILIEDAASGQSIIQELRRLSRLPIIAVPAKGSKEARAAAVSPLAEAQKVWLPEQAAWLGDWIEEHVAFPNAAHDDVVDTTSIALGYLANSFGAFDFMVGMESGAQPDLIERTNQTITRRQFSQTQW